MSRIITLSMPEDLYLQVEQIATETQRDIPDILLETISHRFAPQPVNPNRTAMKREIAAYKALHSELVKMHLGEYVAIYEGDLVDHDSDPVALHRRIKAKYGDKIVLNRKVEQEPD